jgi:hypothetical protein
MSFKPILPLSKVSGWAVASGVAGAAHTVVCEIQPGPRFDNILISGNAGVSKKMTDLIGDIRVIANDEVVRLHSATELNAKNALYGPQYAAFHGNSAHATAANNVFQLPIYFAEPWRKDTLTDDALAWNTRNLRNFRVEVDIKADTFTTPTALSFMAEADTAPLAPDAPGLMGLIVKTDRTTLNLATGWNDVMSFPRIGAYQEINLVSTAITDIEIIQGAARRFGPIGRAQLQARQFNRDMFPIYPALAAAAGAPAMDVGLTTGVELMGGTLHCATRGMTDIVFDMNDKPNSSLIADPSADFNVRLNISAGANVVALYNRLTTL